MSTGLDALYLYAEIVIAFVAFAAIVATLRQSLGTKLTPLQYILFRWFVEVALLLVFVSFTVIVLASVIAPEALAWKYSTCFIVVAIPTYLFSYLRRRAKLEIAMPASSKFVSVGYALASLFLISTLTGWTWAPSINAILIFFTWSLACLFIVFIQFLALFIETES
jgi:hypothetical protein